MATQQVNRPTNVKERDADVQRKLQLYGIATAFQLGKMPSNAQIDTTLNSFLASKALTKPSSKLSTEGQVLVGDVRDVVEQAKLLVLSKNEGNLVQDFIYQTSHYDYKGTTKPTHGFDKATAKSDGDKALQGLKTLGKLLITNGQFRKLLKDASTIARDMAADGAGAISNKARPSKEELATVYDAAPDNTWVEAPKFNKENFTKEGLKKRQKEFLQKNKTGTAVQNADGTVAEEDEATFKSFAKERGDKYRAKGKAYLDEKVPQERRDQLIQRMKKIVLECQAHPDYRQAIETLLVLAETYHGHVKTAGTSALSSGKEVRAGLAQAEYDLRTLLERFANGTSMDGLWESIDAVYREADKDPELKTFFKEVDAYIRGCLLQQGYVLDEAATAEAKRLYGRGKYLVGTKYRTQTYRVVDEFKFLMDQFDKDPQNKAFGQAVNKLFVHLGKDESGKVKFKKHLVKDVTGVVIPAGLQSLSYIPIPRIEYSDPQIDAVIENLVFESDNFMPNLVEFYNNNHVSWGRKLAKAGLSENKHAINVKVGGIQTDMRNVSYYVKRKQGFPSLTDLGVFSLFLAGSGFSFALGLSSASKHDAQHFFKVDSVKVDIDHLKIKVHQSRHKLLFNVFKPIALALLRPILQKVLEKAIRENFNKLDATAYQVKQQANRDGKAYEADAEKKKPNSYKLFFDAAKKRSSESKEKKKAAKAAKPDDKKINFAFTKEDSIFPNIQLPGGFSTKASEYRQQAHTGDSWQSPVFAIGSAAATAGVPAAPKIARKLAPVTQRPGKDAGDEAADGSSVNGGSIGTYETNGSGSTYVANPSGGILSKAVNTVSSAIGH